MKHSIKRTALSTAIALGIAGFAASPAMAWEPTKPVEFVIPAGPGGGDCCLSRDKTPSFLQGGYPPPRPLLFI